jgi:hypothetical protein
VPDTAGPVGVGQSLCGDGFFAGVAARHGLELDFVARRDAGWPSARAQGFEIDRRAA